MPTLSPETIGRVARREIKLDHLVRDYVRERLAYRYVETRTAEAARALEQLALRGALDAGPPILNGV